MQLRISLQPEQQLVLPFNYQHQLQSALYRKLGEVGASDFWHDSGFGGERKFKGFCFGALKGKYRVQEKKLHFENRVALEVRSPVFAFCDALQRSFEQSPTLKLFDTELQLAEASLLNRHIHAQQVTFLAQTPITVYETLRDGSTSYCDPQQEEFYVGICNNFANKYRAIAGVEPQGIMVRPAGEFKHIVTRYKDFYINAYQGPIEAKGTPQELEFLYNTGAGAKSSQGFGFLQLR